jgi:hypothetical protein
VKVQTALEEVCYAFRHEMMGYILQKEGWDCPGSVEPNIWARIFRDNEDKFDVEKLLEFEKHFPELLDSIAQLRYAAVPRVRVSANKVKQPMTDAESLANILHNNTCARMLSRPRRDTQQVIDELGRNTGLLESILKEELQEVEARRRELDSLEYKAVEDMLRDDREYQTLVSTNLEQAIGAPEAIQHSAPTSEHDTISDAEVEGESVGRPSLDRARESTSSCSKPMYITL